MLANHELIAADVAGAAGTQRRHIILRIPHVILDIAPAMDWTLRAARAASGVVGVRQRAAES